MSLQGHYGPSPSGWVRDQVEAYEASGGTQANTLRDTGLPIIIVTTRGNKTGNVRNRTDHPRLHCDQARLNQSGGVISPRTCRDPR